MSHENFTLTESQFDAIPSDWCISGTTETVKYLCANQREIELLKSIGIDVGVCDWIKLTKMVKK